MQKITPGAPSALVYPQHPRPLSPLRSLRGSAAAGLARNPPPAPEPRPGRPGEQREAPTPPRAPRPPLRNGRGRAFPQPEAPRSGPAGSLRRRPPGFFLYRPPLRHRGPKTRRRARLPHSLLPLPSSAESAPSLPPQPEMFGFKRNAVIGLNLYCGGAKLGAGGGDGASPSGKGLLTAGKEAAARREAGGGEAGPGMGGGAGASPPAALAPEARRVARPSPIGAEGPDVTATPARRLFAPVGRAALPAEVEAAAADAIMSPEEELDGYEPEPLGKRPAVLPLVQLVGEASGGPGAGGSLPSTPPPAEEEEEDELFRQSLEIISRYLREQATGAKDAKPLGGPAASSRKALETLRRVGDGVQRNHEMAFQGERGRARGSVGDRRAPRGRKPRRARAGTALRPFPKPA